MKLRTHIILILLLLLGVPSFAAQDDSRQRRDRLKREIALLESRIKANASDNSNALASLTLLRKSISSREALLRESESRLAQINDTIKLKQAEADRLKARRDTLQYYYNRLIHNAYRNRDSRMWYMYILASDNLGQAARRFTYLRDLSSRMNVQARQINEIKSQLDSQLVNLQNLRSAAAQLAEERRAEIKNLRAEEAKSNSLVDKLKKEKKKYQRELEQKRRQVEALNKQVEKLIASEIKSSGKKSGKSGKNTKSKSVSSGLDTQLSGKFASNKGKLPWPCDGVIIDPFGKRFHPVYTSISMPFNNGVNLAVKPGTEVKAVFDGTVKKIIVMPGYNKCVLVQHGEYFSFYCKLGTVSVKAGEKIKLGQKLGVVDTIDSQTQAHIQIWKGGKPQDPELWLKKD